MTYFKRLIAAAVLSIGMLGSAQAAMIEGQLDFTGFAAFERSGSGSTLQYETVKFLAGPFVIFGTGDYSGVPIGSAVSIVDPIDFSNPPIAPTALWSVDIFSFALSSISINDGTTVGGSGTISAAGFQDTDGFWSLTSQGDNSGMFSFSATQIPEAPFIILFALGLIGLGLSRAKVKS